MSKVARTMYTHRHRIPIYPHLLQRSAIDITTTRSPTQLTGPPPSPGGLCTVRLIGEAWGYPSLCHEVERLPWNCLPGLRHQADLTEPQGGATQKYSAFIVCFTCVLISSSDYYITCQEVSRAPMDPFAGPEASGPTNRASGRCKTEEKCKLFPVFSHGRFGSVVNDITLMLRVKFT